MVFAGADNIITSLGFTTAGNFENIRNGNSGLRISNDAAIYPTPLPLSLVDRPWLHTTFFKKVPGQAGIYTDLEMMHILSIKDVLRKSDIDIKSKRSLIILSTTKGNIDLLEPGKKGNYPEERIYLWGLAKMLQKFFGNPNTPLVVSNACISGVLAMVIGSRLIRAGKYDHVMVSGGDIISEFVVSGFQSFQSLSPQPCKPFDVERNGLSLGEGVGTVILSNDLSCLNTDNPIEVLGGASSNDANHISGPSRTGEGLYLAISNAMKESGFHGEDIDFVSAHGTATDYNDEMEAKALDWAGLGNVPVNSFKGSLGHTLGAAGTIESILTLESMRNNILLKTAGYREHGVSVPIPVISENIEKEINIALKIASGFGGCNAALAFSKQANNNKI